jgi:predicted transcriptional regulator of viral defense system
MRGGIGAVNRDLLEHLHRTAHGPFTTTEAAEMLELDAAKAQRLLLYLHSRGWLSRVRQGYYSVVPLGASDPSHWREEPWVIATKVFYPCYIGGWSACEHWSLTEQIFRSVQVHTAKPVRSKQINIQDTPFVLHHVPEKKHFGLKVIWYGQVKVSISDPTRTIVDILDIPTLGGGIQHVSDVFENYFSGEHRNDRDVIAYAEGLGNRTIFKRLGYLLEELNIEANEIVVVCKKNLSSGISVLDPSGPHNGSIVSRWNLLVNANIYRNSPA